MLERFTITGLSDIDSSVATQAGDALESGKVLLFPDYPFALAPEEEKLVKTGLATGRAKNISYDPVKDAVKGTETEGPDLATLQAMLRRYGEFAESLVRTLFPAYAQGLTRARTSFRPAEIKGRVRSWRQDDTRLHVDAFPTSPVKGRRILRVFANIDQDGTPRCWRAGPEFQAYTKQFWPVKMPLPGSATLRNMLGLTKSRRSYYDEAMLALHDAAKRDMEWQKNGADAQDISFMPGQVWMVYTDQLAHAALSGRNALEQTFLVEPDCMIQPERSPLAVLSALAGRNMREPAF